MCNDHELEESGLAESPWSIASSFVYRIEEGDSGNVNEGDRDRYGRN